MSCKTKEAYTLKSGPDAQKAKRLIEAPYQTISGIMRSAMLSQMGRWVVASHGESYVRAYD